MSRKTHATDLVIVPLWTRVQAEKAAPYLSATLRSLRETLLDAKQHSLTAERLASKTGRPDRAARIALDDALRDDRRARESLHESLEELEALGVNCLDPLRGEALVPFAHQGTLAWFIYDLFAAKPLSHWRYHTDSLQTRRPIEDIPEDAAPERSAAGTPPGTEERRQSDDDRPGI